MTKPSRKTSLTRGSFALAAIAQAALLAACTSQVVKQSSPTIDKSIGDRKAPAENVLPIIKSENIAPDPQKAADNYRKLLDLRADEKTEDEAIRRLADLQVQMAEAEGATAQSEKTVRESINLYQKLLDTKPNDPNNDRVLYQLSRAQQNIGDVDAAIQTLQQLTTTLPNSHLAGDAHFRRGELLFAKERYPEAENEYRTVMTLKDATPFFETAQYKYGWSLYKQSKYDAAIATFFDILDRELPKGEMTDPTAALAGVSKEKYDLAKDSLRVITLSLATQGGGSALNDYLAKHGDPRFYPLIYVALGEAMLEKNRYTDGANAFAAFIKRYARSPLSPSFQTRVINAYKDGGFADLALQEKERYVTTYDPAAEYWQGKPATAEVMTTLRTHLDDLAKYYHSVAQQKQRAAQTAAQPTPDKPIATVNAAPPAEFLVAARWYRRIIDIYKQDPKLPEINFLLADALLDGGKTLEAAQEYSKTAYNYPDHPKKAEAAYAAVLAYTKNAKSVPPAEHAAALKLAIDESLKLAEKFPQHPQRYAVLALTAENLYALKDYDRAIATADQVIKAQAGATNEQKRLAWSVTGDAQFAQQRYPQAETAFSEELKLTPPNEPRRGEIGEQLAASIYKQGEAARGANDMKTAAGHFLRLGQITPQAKIRATSEYDGAAALLALEDWTQAEVVLENFRRTFPGHQLEADVDKKLATAYQKDKKPLQAAQAYGRIARRNGEAPATREEAAWQSASLFDEGKSPGEAAAAYQYYVQSFPNASFDRGIEARGKLVDSARTSGNSQQLTAALREQITQNDTAGGRATERSRALAAKASLELGRLSANETQAIAITAPLEKSLPRRKELMEQTLGLYNKAAGYGFADVTTAATFETGKVYQTFSKALLDSERPKKLSDLELEQYELLLEEQANPFDEKAVQTYEANLRRIGQGVYDEWIAKSLQALVTMAPGQYGKNEKGQDRYESLQ